MKILMLWPSYSEWLDGFHARHPETRELTFGEHRRMILEDHNGWPYDLGRYIKTMGVDVEIIIGNAERLQRQWAEENGFTGYTNASWEKEIAFEQIRRFRPDVLWLPSYQSYYGSFLRSVAGYCGKVASWAGEPHCIPRDLSGVDVFITESMRTLAQANRRFKKTVVTKPGFDPDILKRLGPVEKQYDLSFSGQISGNHRKRAETLSFLLRQEVQIEIFALIRDEPRLPVMEGIRIAAWCLLKGRNASEALRTLRRSCMPNCDELETELIQNAARQSVFGMDLYRVLASSACTLNVHADSADGYAGNMRMFEATGVGTCLITEHAENIDDLFEPGKEVLTYKSKDELVDVIKQVKAYKRAAEAIAKNGQTRTLACHTLKRMWDDIRPSFES